jgi:hypothetical protein
MRTVLSLLLLLLFVLAACNGSEAETATVMPAADAETIVVYKSPT